MAKDVIKYDLERKSLSWIIWMGLWGPHMHPYMWAAERDRHTEKVKWKWSRERSSCKPRNANSHEKLAEAGHKLAYKASRGSAALWTSWFSTSGLQKCERIHFCSFKFKIPPSLCILLWQPQESNIPSHEYRFGQGVVLSKSRHYALEWIELRFIHFRSLPGLLLS